MIVYKKNKQAFIGDVENGAVEDIIKEAVKEKLNLSVGNSEYLSWKNSLQYMFHILNTETIPTDSGVAIEYNIPGTSNRIDFILTGQNENGDDHAVLIELKQWSNIKITDQDAIVMTQFQHRYSRATHPSYQAWSYSTLLYGFNETVYTENISLKPCAYLHNYVDNNVISNPFYAPYLEKAPAFFKGERDELQNFIKKFIKYGDKTDIIFRIENSKIKPAKSLADSMASLIKGNPEFVMIDSQKLAFEKALAMAKHSDDEKKNVLIVSGGPGTGKSVVAVNLLVSITKKGLFAQYVTKNAAPRTVYESKLTGTLNKTQFSNMFRSSGSFVEAKTNMFDALIVDEAHRLNAKSGMFKNKGENQIKEIINASKFSVFFIDEDQKVTLDDIGRKEEIERWATFYNITPKYEELTSQFRCNGSNGYLAWLDNTLQIRETANKALDKNEYDFRIIDDPNTLRDLIFEKNKESNKARLVAGYCWDWDSKKNPEAMDIIIPEHNFQMRWNLGSDGMLWIIKPESVNEVGCIHTSQGLEVDYIGVIIGKDLICRDGEIITDAAERSKMDKSVFGWKKRMKENPTETKVLLDAIIKNTYRTLMSRGMRGCYVYFEDQETSNYFKELLTI